MTRTGVYVAVACILRVKFANFVGFFCWLGYAR